VEQVDLRSANPNYRFAWHFLDGLVHAGLRRVCVAPGYLNSPLLLTIADHPSLRSHVFHDERAAAFAGVGMARASGEPVAVMATAGTAAAELHPAVVEAWQSRIPVLFLTADRPPELRDVGERQSVDQVHLYGRAVKWYHEAALPGPRLDLLPYIRALAIRAWSEAVELPRGPVHINFPFREPLPPTAITADVAAPAEARTPAYFPARAMPAEAALVSAADLLSGRRALVVAGELPGRREAQAVHALGAKGGFPIFADPLSYLRAGAHDPGGLFFVMQSGVGAVDPRRVMRQALGLPADEEPEVVIRFGAPPVSKALNAWLGSRRTIPQIVVDDGRWRDPAALATTVIRGDTALVAEALGGRLASSAPLAWTARWRSHLEGRRKGLDATLAASVPFPSEPGVVLALAEAVPDRANIVVGASMPIRDVDSFFPLIRRDVAILSNRGASGIDGLLATAVGTALADTTRPTYALAGDLSVLHDLGSLRAAALHAVPLTVIVLNNDGGGIFHFVPQVDYPHFESHVVAPHATQFAPVGQALGLASRRMESRAEFLDWVAQPTTGPRLIEIRTDRCENARLHEAIWAALDPDPLRGSGKLAMREGRDEALIALDPTE
jgi:2-succinyl-5-enolpyruvyl-6-hydroxy-3-cyclohexene-1-carboxylate synthase